MNSEHKIITFGYGPYDKEGKEYVPIEWIVLDEKSNLLISKNIITSYPYHRGDVDYDKVRVPWAECDLRRSLNREFLNRFYLERRRLLPVGLGPCGSDKVTLLSFEELERYLPERKDRASEDTPFRGSAGDWWGLRMEYVSRWSRYVLSDGSVDSDFAWPSDSVGIRPVIRLR